MDPCAIKPGIRALRLPSHMYTYSLRNSLFPNQSQPLFFPSTLISPYAGHLCKAKGEEHLHKMTIYNPVDDPPAGN